jgi:hypothetical protein
MRKCAVVAAAMLGGLITTASADLVSSYSVSGRMVNGTSYTGSVNVAPSGQIYRFDYCCDKLKAVAIEYQDFLAAAYIGDDGNGDLNIYQRAGDAWVGVYSDYDTGRLGVEALYNGNAPDLPDPKQRSGNPAGKYRIAGTNPNGSTYSGEVEIKPWASAFDIDRTIGKDETTGTGVSLNGAIAFNIDRVDQTKRAPIGIVGLFVPEGKDFVGVWVKSGTDRLGAERWVRE